MEKELDYDNHHNSQHSHNYKRENPEDGSGWRTGNVSPTIMLTTCATKHDEDGNNRDDDDNVEAESKPGDVKTQQHGEDEDDDDEDNEGGGGGGLAAGHVLEDESIKVMAGYVSGEYSCMWENCNGTLYGGSKALCFEGGFNFFGLFDNRRRLVLRWEDVRQVHKTDDGILEVVHRATSTGQMVVEQQGSAAGSTPADVDHVVAASTNTTVVHSFHGLRSPHKVWMELLSLHNDALLDHRGRRKRRRRRSKSAVGSSSVITASAAVVNGELSNSNSTVATSSSPSSPTVITKRRNSDPYASTTTNIATTTTTNMTECVTPLSSSSSSSLSHKNTSRIPPSPPPPLPSPLKAAVTTFQGQPLHADDDNQDEDDSSSQEFESMLLLGQGGMGIGLGARLAGHQPPESQHQPHHQRRRRLSTSPVRCQLDKFWGILYVGERAIYFHGNKVFFWEEQKKFLVKWRQIQQLQLLGCNDGSNPKILLASSSPSSVRGNAEAKDDNVTEQSTSVRSGRGAGGVAAAGALIIRVEIVQDEGISNGDRNRLASSTSFSELAFSTKTDAKRTWDRMVHSYEEYFTHLNDGIHRHDDDKKSGPPASPGISVAANRPKMYLRMNSDPNIPSAVSDDDDEDVDDYDDDAASGDSRDGPRQPNSHYAVTPERIASVRRRRLDCGARTTSLEERWMMLVRSSGDGKTYPDLVIKDLLLSCDLDKFFDLFVRDDARYSIARFLETERGDRNLDEAPWERENNKDDEESRDDEDDNDHDLRRVVQYTHPVNVPLAPPTGDARKKQRYRRYGEQGLCIETTTIVDDVPMTDCFYVADRIVVQRRGPSRKGGGQQNDEAEASSRGQTEEEDFGGGVLVTMEFDIRFIKSTMFRGIIGKTTASEFQSMFRSLADYYVKAIAEDRMEKTNPQQHPLGEGLTTTTDEFLHRCHSSDGDMGNQATTGVKDRASYDQSSSSSYQPILFAVIFLVLGLILALQIWIVIELRDLKRKTLLELSLDQERRGETIVV